ncbi:substrate-binding domain-containing protein [Myxococcus sp. CA051A]|uniref:substrate-binding domain-containing protein n=1 Tax=unclassified Myxococcus TaxID=2648731 RepID=UPI00157A4439|nr:MULTISPECIES: substrate-binding domain-containing protein [unclassified Myxococcus]NTX09787.1 substrate-binding domain-containing protein [Myxococcus sp. CA056]NTX35147.1 substrate-binding domain-containing protein [Myxococcus sp. CA033]NTX57071.1 substrate-binding domain-containing protein [Myxococcus sp. CA039A]NTX65114.1 substrate-binding domain-containing protein [Myxococcus sp. CA051A]
MNSMKWVMSATVVAMSVVGCGGQSGAGAQTAQAVEQKASLAIPNFHGSDTLKEALIAANIQSGAGLNIEGKGSGVGEACLRNGVGSSGFCGSGAQTLAPMSRDFAAPKTASGAACVSGTATGACCPGERSNTIALDAVSAFVSSARFALFPDFDPSSGVEKGLTTEELRRIFFATDSAGVAITGACPTNWNAFGQPSATIVKYRRDDLSGTTDTFKSLLKGGTFCPGITVIVDGSVSNPSPCTSSDSATTCIGKLTVSNNNAIAYAGDSATQTGNDKLHLKAVAPITPTTSKYIAPSEANVRKLLQSGATDVYPLSRRIFLNENVNRAKSFEEGVLYEWIYDTNSTEFEEILTQQGFIACAPEELLTPLACGGNLGRGAGLCSGI